MDSIYQLVEVMEKKYADRIAFQYYDRSVIHQVTYGEFVNDIKLFAAYLHNIFPDIIGKHIGVLAQNGYSYFVCLYGIQLAQAIIVPLNIEEEMDVMKREVEFADITVIFSDGVYENREEKYQKYFSNITIDIEDYRKYVTRLSLHNIQEDDNKDCLTMLLFTSGTTGDHKAVMLSKRNIFAPIQHFIMTVDESNIKESLKLLFISPCYHISGIALALTYNVLGSTINICKSAKYLYRDLELFDSDCTLVVPMILYSWHKDLIKGKRNRLGNIKLIGCGGAPLDGNVIEDFIKNGIQITQGYALTEIFGGGTTNTSTKMEKVNSVGKPGINCELKIENNEVLFRSDAVMMGYYKNPEATKEAIQEGWLHTGDLGYLDSDGYLYLTGRKKNLIILSGGENVSPEELEGMLLKCTSIYEVLVKEQNDKICAVIYSEKEKQESIKQYVTDINRKLPYYKRITVLDFREKPLEKTATGKLKR